MNSAEKIQLLYEISMEIGGSLELKKMLRRSLTAIMRKLNLAGGSVLLFENPGDYSSPLKTVLSIPKKISSNTIYKKAVDSIPNPFDNKAIYSFSQKLPFCSDEFEEACFFIFQLKDCGFLVLVKYGKPSKDLIFSLTSIINRLADACYSCYQNEQLEKSHEALKKSENKYKNIFENVQDVFFQIDLSGKITEISPSIERFMQYTRQEQIGKPFKIFYASQDSYQSFNTIMKKKGEVVDFEITLKDKSGKNHFVSVNAHPLFGENGKPIGIEGSMRDITERKRAEEQISKLSQAVEQSPALVIITDLQGNIEYVNPMFTRISGYTLSEVKGKTPSILKSGEKSKVEYKELWDTITHGDIWRGEFHNKKKNGELYWEKASIGPIKNKQGEITHFLAIKEDITERRKMENKIKNLAKFPDENPDPVMRIDKNGQVLYSNKACSLLMENADFRPEDHWPENMEQFIKSSIKGNQSIEFTIECEHQIFSMMLTPVEGEEYLNIYGRNVTELRHSQLKIEEKTQQLQLAYDQAKTYASELSAEIKIRKREQKRVFQIAEELHQFIETANSPIFGTDTQGRVNEWNEAVQKITKFSKEEILGKKLVEEFITDEFKNSVKTVLDNALQGIETANYELLFYTKDKRRVIILLNASTRRDVDGKIIGVLGVGQDITERKLMEEVLRESDKLKSDFISSVSHEFRTPLASIMGFSQTILAEPDMEKETRVDFLQTIYDESNRLARLIENVLNISKIQAGEISFNVEPVHVDLLLQEIFELEEMKANSHHLSYELTIDDNIPEIQIDADAFKQIALNLISNAIKFTPEAGSVKVQLTNGVKDIILTVQDTGLGIPEDDRQKIFERFYRVYRPGHEIQGTGLGLPIVHEIVSYFKGNISVDSETGKGTLFTVSLPLE